MKKFNVKYEWILIGVFLCLLLYMRFTVSSHLPYFSDDESYHTARILKEFTGDGTLSSIDPFTQQTRVANYFFYFFLSMFAIGENEVSTLRIATLVSSCVLFIVSMLISRLFTTRIHITYLTGLLSVFVPFYFLSTLNSFSQVLFLFPFFLVFVYLFWRWIVRGGMPWPILIVGLICIALHPSFLLILLGLFFAHLLSFLEQKKQSTAPFEILLVLVLFAVSWNYLYYYQVFFQLQETVLFYFVTLPNWGQLRMLLILLPLGGLFVFAGAALSFYHSVIKEQNHVVMGVFSTILVLILSAFVGFVDINVALALCSVLAVLLCADWLNVIEQYAKKTHFSPSLVVLITMAIVFISVVIPSVFFSGGVFAQALPSDLIHSYEWINENSPHSTVLVIPSQFEHVTIYYTNRSIVKDSTEKFGVNKKNNIVDSLFEMLFTSQVLSTLQAVNINNPETQPLYFISHPLLFQSFENKALFLHDECFQPIFIESNVRVSVITCSLQ